MLLKWVYEAPHSGSVYRAIEPWLVKVLMGEMRESEYMWFKDQLERTETTLLLDEVESKIASHLDRYLDYSEVIDYPEQKPRRNLCKKLARFSDRLYICDYNIGAVCGTNSYNILSSLCDDPYMKEKYARKFKKQRFPIDSEQEAEDFERIKVQLMNLPPKVVRDMFINLQVEEKPLRLKRRAEFSQFRKECYVDKFPAKAYQLKTGDSVNFFGLVSSRAQLLLWAKAAPSLIANDYTLLNYLQFFWFDMLVRADERGIEGPNGVTEWWCHLLSELSPALQDRYCRDTIRYITANPLNDFDHITLEQLRVV